MQHAATAIVPTRSLDHGQSDAAIGALIGLAVSDALGAPFEFGAAGEYRGQYPEPVLGGVGEMTGGGGFRWAPGEFTDDTQMALALAESIIATRSLDLADLWQRWRDWAARRVCTAPCCCGVSATLFCCATSLRKAGQSVPRHVPDMADGLFASNRKCSAAPCSEW